MTFRRRFACVVAIALPALLGAAPTTAQAWSWPLPPPHLVLRGFAPPAHAWLAGHRGVDLAAGVGEQVTSAGAGTVAFAGRVGGVGVVAVRHADGLETTYEPVTPTVARGRRVAVGAVIGRVAPSDHCGSRACLHWGLRRGAGYLDPLSLVGGGRVRLLPLTATGSAQWLVPAASGASVGSSAVVLGWAVVSVRRRRRPLPPGVTSIRAARSQRSDAGRVSRECR